MEKSRRSTVGQTLDVLFEHRRTADGMLTGLSGNYFGVRIEGPDMLMGSIAQVEITDCDNTGLRGRLKPF